jgi:1-acyl-sn-glycerol-3-phosphate acyltransferase
MFVKFLYKVFRLLLFKIHVHGAKRVRGREPFVLVSNHAGSFGPISIITSFPYKLYPWVDHEVTDPRTAAKRIQAEFLEAELHLKAPLSVYLGKVIGRVCVALMKGIDAIPVYGHSKAISLTVDRSLRLLGEGKNILVFPENPRKPVNEAFCDFYTGFLHLAKKYFQQTRKALSFFPVAVNRKKRSIVIGEPLQYDTDAPFPVEKARLKKELERRIYTMYCSLEDVGELKTASGGK